MRGPVFAELVLADEINRAPAKTQAALLEAMQESQVTIDGTTHRLPDPFFVIATENPVESEGTYPLPEAQLDRFIVRAHLGYPAVVDEVEMVAAGSPRGTDEVVIRQVTSTSQLDAVRAAIEQVHVEPVLVAYVVDIINASRKHRELSLGASPRGSLAVIKVARGTCSAPGRATSSRRTTCRAIALPALTHRVVLSDEAWARGTRAHDVMRAVSTRSPRRAGSRQWWRSAARPRSSRRATSGSRCTSSSSSSAPRSRHSAAGSRRCSSSRRSRSPWRWGCAAATDAVIRVRVTLDTQRCLEGDTVGGRIDITGPPGTTIEVAIECPTTALTAPHDDPWAWHIAADVATPIGLPLAIETNRWGRFSSGQLLVRVIDHGSLLDRRAHVMDLPDVMVLPIARHLDQLLPPAAAHAALGAHPARRRTGDGYDFAEIRAYQPGDRVRDLNWRATLRRGEPHVNRRHPERVGDVVIVLDAFPDSLRGQTEVGEDVILRAGRAAWAIAREHLDANDRVGFVAEGANPVWLPPAPAGAPGTRCCRHCSTRSARRRQPNARSGRSVASRCPPAALVIAISPLGRERTMRMMIGLRGAGRSVAVMAIDTIDWLTEDWLTEHGTSSPEGARRIAQLTFEERIATLRRQGVPVVEWRPSDDLGRAVRLLGRVRNRTRSAA